MGVRTNVRPTSLFSLLFVGTLLILSMSTLSPALSRNSLTLDRRASLRSSAVLVARASSTYFSNCPRNRLREAFFLRPFRPSHPLVLAKCLPLLSRPMRFSPLRATICYLFLSLSPSLSLFLSVTFR